MNSIGTLTEKAPELVTWLFQKGLVYGLKLLVAISVFIIGWWFIKFIIDRVFILMDKANIDATLRTFIRSILAVSLKIVLIVSVLSMVGIEMTTFIAMLSAASLAVALAFRGSLSNLAGGIMILFFKPFRVGDFITAQGHSGTVQEIQIFNTYLATSDNKVVIIPNGHLSNGLLVNNSMKDVRRVDWVFGIGYGDNYDAAKEMIMGFIQADTRILNSPAEPLIVLSELADSSVNLVVRVWVKSPDYWSVFFGLNEVYYKNAAKLGFKKPFPQMYIHFDKNQLN